ncbi:MAG: hypothetical protein ABIE03_05600 [Patescibacteria group bacterium]|nr:hypothetical protein [Patescibacteria group bacterium]
METDNIHPGIIAPFKEFGLELLDRRTLGQRGLSLQVLQKDPFQGQFREVMQRTKLVNDPIPGYRPYRGREISLRSVPLYSLSIAAYYVIKENLEFSWALHEALLREGIDTLALTADCARIHFQLTRLKTEETSKCMIASPLVEVSLYDPGNPEILVDGLHRAALARLLGYEHITVLHIDGAYAPLQPLPIQWKDLNVWDRVPPREMKKLYRFTSAKQAIRHQNETWTQFRQGFDDIPSEREYLFALIANNGEHAAPLAGWLSRNWELYFSDLSIAEERAWALPLIQRYYQNTKEVAHLIASNWDKYREGLSIEQELHFLFQFLLRHPEETLVRWVLCNFSRLKAGFEDHIDAYDFLQNAIISQLKLPLELRWSALGLLPRRGVQQT